MATATIPLHASARPATGARRAKEAGSTLGAAILSILGSMVAIGVVALGVLVAPVAAVIVFGPMLLDLL